MNTQRLGLHLGRQLRSPAFRSTFQRRFASEQTELKGVADNAFNRERAAAKSHAAATSGVYRSRTGLDILYSTDRSPADLWRRLSI